MLKRKHRVLAAAAAGVSFGLLVQSFSQAATVTWSGAAPDDNWSDPLNWGGTPVAGNDAVFNNTDVVATPGSINNIVDQTLTINSLKYTNQSLAGTSPSLGYHTTQIPTGVTLTISGTAAATVGNTGAIALSVGTETDEGKDTIVQANITGGGTLVINSPGDLQVRQGSATGGAHQAVLDLSGLATLTATVDQLNIGFNGSQPVNRTSGKLILGDTTTITARSTGQAIVIGGTNSNAGAESQIELGHNTTFNAVQMQVANTKANGRVYFRQGQTDALFTIRGSNGASARMSTLAIGDNFNAGSTGGGVTGVMDLTGGAADFMVDNLYVGRTPSGGTASGTPSNFGTLTVEKGTIDTNALEIGFQTASSGYCAVGTVNVNGTALIVVNNNLRLGRTLGGAGTTAATLNLNSGTVRVFGDVVTQGQSATLNLAGGTLDMQPTGDATPGSVTATTLNLTSGTLKGAAVVRGNQITVGSGLTVTGPTAFEITNNGLLDASAAGTFALNPGGAIRGNGNVNGSVLVTSGSTIAPGTGSAAGTLTFNNDLTLDANATLAFKLAPTQDVGNGVNDLLNVNGTLAFNGTAVVSISGVNGGPATGTYRLINFSNPAAAISGTNLVVLGQTRQTFTLDTATAGQVNVTVGPGTGPQTLVWTGGSNAKWDVATSFNWRNTATAAADRFFAQDAVTFDDTATNPSPTVELVGALAPASVTVNAARDYTFTGAGSLTGAASLTKSGTGTLVIANTGANDYTGGTVVNAGVLRVGAGNAAGNLPATGGVTNNAALVFNRSDAITFANVISGAGNLRIASGTVTLAGTSTFTGTTTVDGGAVVRVTNGSNNAGLGSSLGSGTAAVFILPGATLDLSGNTTQNSLNFGQKQFFIEGTGVGGLGAIVNTGVQQQLAFEKIALTGDATIGGTQRYDIRETNGVNISTLDLQGHTLTKIGSNQFSLVAVDVSESGNIVVNGGTFSVETTSVMGGTNTVTFNDGTTAQFFSNTNTVSAITRPMIFNGAVRVGTASNNNNTIIGSNILLNGNVTAGINNNATSSFTLTGTISETGGPRNLTKTTASVLNLTAANTYSGVTTINAGTVNASVLANGGVPSGIGQSGPAATNLVLSGGGTLGYTGAAPATTDRLFTIGTGGAGLNAAGAAGAPVLFSANAAIPITATAAATFTLGGTNTDANLLAGKLQDGPGAAAPLSLRKVDAANWTLSGQNTYSGTTTVDAGTLRVTGSIANTAGLTVNAGTYVAAAPGAHVLKSLAANGGSVIVSAGTLKVGDNTAAVPLSFNGSLIDLTSRGLVVDVPAGNDVATVQTIRSQILNGYSGGTWLGAPGITSSVAAADTSRAVGYALASEVLGPAGGTFMDAPVDADAVLVRQTLYGDANLDGAVNFNDLVRLAQNYNTTVSATTDSWWYSGDFTYDGMVDFNDLVKLAQNYNTALPAGAIPGAPANFGADLAAAFAAVPEPSSALVAIAASGLAGLTRRRRRSASGLLLQCGPNTSGDSR